MNAKLYRPMVAKGEKPMGEKQEIRGKMEVAGITGPIWILGWLFTIGYAHLPMGKSFLAILLWPYYLGRALG